MRERITLTPEAADAWAALLLSVQRRRMTAEGQPKPPYQTKLRTGRGNPRHVAPDAQNRHAGTADESTEHPGGERDAAESSGAVGPSDGAPGAQVTDTDSAFRPTESAPKQVTGGAQPETGKG